MSRSRLAFFAIIGLAVLVVIVAGIVVPVINQGQISATQTGTYQSATSTVNALRANVTTLKVVYGTEKDEWFKPAVQQFMAQNPDVNVILDGEGSMDVYQALSHLTPTSTSIDKLSSARDNDIPTVWSPASMIQVNLLNGTNQMNSDHLATNCKSLVLSPLVFFAWQDRADAFSKKYPDGVNFGNLYDAFNPKGTIKGTWGTLGGNPNWGLIKLGHTDPRKSNSGIMMLVAMANNMYKTTKAVTGAQVSDAAFQDYVNVIESGINPPLISSTGTFADDVIAKGPAAYDVVVVYEALGIENFDRAQGRQQQSLHVFYTPFNLYSDHPFCTIDHPAITQKQRDAAQKLQDFLLSQDIQRLALKYGFRPADTSIAIFSSDPSNPSPFDKYKSNGISSDIGQLIAIPDGPTINNLLAVWSRNTPNQ
ncbi:MAG TPA: substrate-binding domain-containing protein [Aggregatilineaceae bacterium]|nr:substrate-binding domain-containing protein [Aggregatilineaceae bacterium]